jgi:Zn-dependent protease with chaperone function
MRGRRLFLAATLGCCGCLWDQRVPDNTPQMPKDPVLTEKRIEMVQASTQACTRVYTIGQRILAANPDLPRRLVFRAAGQPTPEIFHQGSNAIVVTQKLVDMCKTDAELAAVLALEMGKMSAERIVLAPLDSAEPEIHRPIDPGRIGNEVAGVANVQDPFRLQEMALYEEDQRKQLAASRLPDPNRLARLYLRRAGYSETELDHAKPILRAADEHSELQRQMTSIPKSATFDPPGGN